MRRSVPARDEGGPHLGGPSRCSDHGPPPQRYRRLSARVGSRRRLGQRGRGQRQGGRGARTASPRGNSEPRALLGTAPPQAKGRRRHEEGSLVAAAPLLRQLQPDALGYFDEALGPFGSKRAALALDIANGRRALLQGHHALRALRLPFVRAPSLRLREVPGARNNWLDKGCEVAESLKAGDFQAVNVDKDDKRLEGEYWVARLMEGLTVADQDFK